MVTVWKAAMAATLLALGAGAHSQWVFTSGTAYAQSRIDFDIFEPGKYAPTAYGSAPPAFDVNVTESLTSFDDIGRYSVSIGSQAYRAASNVDGVPGVGYKFARAETRIEDFELVIGDPQDPFFTFSFDSLERISFTEGDDPETYAGAGVITMSIVNGQMTYLGNPIAVPVNPTFNHEFVNTGPGGPYEFFAYANVHNGIIISGDGIPTPGGPTYILVELARDHASMEAFFVPEPSTFIAACLGGSVLLVLRRRCT